MPVKFNLYDAWMDPYFYVWAALLAAALVAMVYSIRRYLELKNASDFEDGGQAEIEKPVDAEQAERAEEAEQSELLATHPDLWVEPRPQPGPAAAGPEPLPAPAAAQEPTRAENFVRGIYEGISDLDERMKGIESALSKNHVNSDFTVKFLEDILQDIDSLDKGKIKARIEYLLSDLKK
ncbi:MAG: hypothetical protein Q7R35_07275 [Elusimicrobiota bacterium]|nr:hypothetical protein [Elusimicrobiota bacterium]